MFQALADAPELSEMQRCRFELGGGSTSLGSHELSCCRCAICILLQALVVLVVRAWVVSGFGLQQYRVGVDSSPWDRLLLDNHCAPVVWLLLLAAGGGGGAAGGVWYCSTDILTYTVFLLFTVAVLVTVAAAVDFAVAVAVL